jgi:hypothetical protein
MLNKTPSSNNKISLTLPNGTIVGRVAWLYFHGFTKTKRGFWLWSNFLGLCLVVIRQTSYGFSNRTAGTRIVPDNRGFREPLCPGPVAFYIPRVWKMQLL